MIAKRTAAEMSAEVHALFNEWSAPGAPAADCTLRVLPKSQRTRGFRLRWFLADRKYVRRDIRGLGALARDSCRAA